MNKTDETPIPMVLETETRTVRIPISDGNIFTFEDGVPAFEDYKQFVLYCNTEMQPFFFMKSIGITPEVSFVCVDPFLVSPNYQVKIGAANLKALNLKRGEDAFVFSFVTVHDDPSDITANLQGPVVLNLKNSRGRQIISEGTKYDVRFKVWDALMQVGDESAELDDPLQLTKNS